MSEDKLRRIKALAREILFLCENIPDYEKEEQPESPPPKAGEAKRTLFEDIMLEDTEFDVWGVDVSKIFPEKAGTTKEGTAWTKQSIILTDASGDTRELIAWGSTIEKYRGLRVGDRVNILCVAKVSTYTYSKTGKTVIQFTIGGNTELERIVTKAEEYFL